MPEGPDAYEVLGLPEDAQPEEIRKAYRSLALQRHPDKSPPEGRAAAEDAFKELVDAYDTLRDPDRRHEYDELRRSFTAPLRRCSSSPMTEARSCPSTPSRGTRSRHRSKEAATLGRIPRWGWGRPFTPDILFLNEWPGRVGKAVAQDPGSVRVWFAKGSSSIGRDQDGRGDKADGRVEARLATLQAVGRWAASQPLARVDIRGCSQKGEASLGARERDALGLSRCERTLSFLTARCGVPAEKCHASRRLGDDFQGVEIRTMMRLEVEGAFKADSNAHLKCESTLDTVADAMRRAPNKHLLLEVQYTRSERVAQRRASALRQALSTLGIAPQRMCGRVQAGLAEEVSFLIYEEFWPAQDSSFR